jgi:fumarate hydratase class II
MRMPDEVNTAVLLEILKDLRNELRHQRALLLETVDQGRALERLMDAHHLALHQRLSELKQELEQTIKGEITMLMAGLEADAAGG